jgi:hypothetical protein
MAGLFDGDQCVTMITDGERERGIGRRSLAPALLVLCAALAGRERNKQSAILVIRRKKIREGPALCPRFRAKRQPLIKLSYAPLDSHLDRILAVESAQPDRLCEVLAEQILLLVSGQLEDASPKGENASVLAANDHASTWTRKIVFEELEEKPEAAARAADGLVAEPIPTIVVDDALPAVGTDEVRHVEPDRSPRQQRRSRHPDRSARLGGDAQRLAKEPLLLDRVNGRVSLARTRTKGPTGIDQTDTLRQRLLKPMPNRAPRPHVLRLFLNPDNLGEVRVLLKKFGIGRHGERIQLLESSNSETADVIEAFVAHHVVVDPT